MSFPSSKPWLHQAEDSKRSLADVNAIAAWTAVLSTMEPGQRKSIALTKFQQAGKATINKIKKQKSEAKVPKQQGFDVQIGSLLFAAWIVLWIVAASVISAVFFVRYIGIVEDNQAWYLQHGSARSAAAETTAVLQAAIEAKEALIASINFGLIKTSYDYAAIESTLAPTLLLQPFLRTFDITFSDRTAGLHIRHQAGEGGPKKDISISIL